MSDTPADDGWDEAAHWVTEADRYDEQLSPFTSLLFERLGLGPHDIVLDVGCGCGAITIDAGRRAAAAVGVDVSDAVLDVGRRRAEAAGVANVEFVHADASRHAFTAGGFDAIFSRFGVMFFDDPVGAFINLRCALRVGGRLVFVCWQGLEANQWLLVPGAAAAAHVALPALGDSGAPGMFSLANRDHLSSVLLAAGFTNIEIEPVSPTITLGGGGGLDDTIEFMLGTGIARALLNSAEPDARRRAIDAMADAFADYYVPDRGVVLGTGVWLVGASRTI